MAHRLKMSPRGYRDIERGETDIPLSRLLEIAEKLEVRPAEIFDFNDKNIFQVGNNCTLENLSQINSYPPPTSVLQHELEKAQLLIEHLKQQNADLRANNADLRANIELYQKTRNQEPKA